MKNNQRNLMFMFLTIITFAAALALYLKLDSEIQKEDTFMALMIVDGILLAGTLMLLVYDNFSGGEEAFDEERLNAVMVERRRNRVLSEQKLLASEEIGKYLMHTHYAFENWRNSWRTLYIMVTHVFILSSLVVFFVKLGGGNPDFIVGLVFGVFALVIHIGFLLYSLYAQYYLKEYRQPLEMVRQRKMV